MVLFGIILERKVETRSWSVSNKKASDHRPIFNRIFSESFNTRAKWPFGCAPVQPVCSKARGFTVMPLC